MAEQYGTYQYEANRYMECMKEISMRVKNLKSIFSKQAIPTEPYKVEYVCLHIRFITETLFLPNFTANSRDFDMAFKKLVKSAKHGEIRRNTRNKNKNYYPRPVEIEDADNGDEKAKKVTVRQGAFITQQDLVAIWCTCSNFLHAINPFEDLRDYAKVSQSFEGWINNICELLKNHIITLSGAKEYFICSVSFDKGNTIDLIHAGDFIESQVQWN